MRVSERVARLLVVPLAVAVGLLIIFRPGERSSDPAPPARSGAAVSAGGSGAPEASRTAEGAAADLALPPADPAAPPAEPSGILSEGRLVLRGSVPGEAVAAAYARRLAAVLGDGGVTVEMTVDERVQGDSLRIDMAPSFPSPLAGPPADTVLEPLLATSTTVLGGLPDATLVLTGHTDDTGTEATSLALSVAQAQLVADFLVARGVAPARIEVRGAGEEQPVASNDTAEGRLANQRVAASFVGIAPG